MHSESENLQRYVNENGKLKIIIIPESGKQNKVSDQLKQFASSVSINDGIIIAEISPDIFDTIHDMRGVKEVEIDRINLL